MRSRIAAFVVLAALVGCRAGDSTRPGETFYGSPSFDIKDGANTNGNADFFFLPPMAANPVGSAKYDASQFDASLSPTVRICPEVGPCSSFAATLQDGSYKYNWTAPANAGTATFRVTVLLGTTELGFADVKTASKQNDLKDVDKTSYVTVLNGQTLPIKFRIEANAMCLATNADCVTKIVNFNNGGTVNKEIGDDDAGVIIPPGSGTTTHKVTVAPCADLNPEVTDLKTFGPCVSVTADPELPPGGLLQASIVYICAVIPEVEALDEPQHDRVTMHKYDPGVLKAIPHADACGTSTASIGSLKGFYGALKRGSLKQAGRQVVGMLAPKTLNAATRRLDVGAGGEALDWSRFQFALPSKLEIVAGNNQSAVAGSTVTGLTVRVVDLGGDPVVGARVRFNATSEGCEALGNVVGTLSADGTGALGVGEVSTSLALSATPGSNSLAACGRGIAGTVINGPRAGVDPFQPLALFLGDGSDGVEVTVLTGSVLFSATGTPALPNAPIAFGSGGYNSFGPFSGAVTPPAGWPNPAPGTSSIIGGTAPFLGSYGGCTITTGFNGNATFPAFTDIFVTKAFNAPVGGTLVATIRVDNDVRVWLDGTELTNTMPQTANGIYAWWDNPSFWKHDNCADDAPPVLTVTGLAAGPHTLSLWAHDRGEVGYLDVQITVTPP
jgi:hypothetical protein